ncbi:MAG: outer membrane lipoprotein carrier protein LolA [Nitrospinota bacterium]
MKIREIIPKVLAALVLTIFVAQPASALSQKEIIERVEKRFASIRSFTANFQQNFYNATMDEVEKSSGTVKLKKPLKMVWNYEKPETQLLVADGKKIYFYVPADRQVIVESLKNILGASSPLLFLAGEKRLDELFTISLENGLSDGLAGDENKDKIHYVELNLEPKEKSVSVTRMVIRADAKDYTIKSFTLYDWTGNHTEVVFEDMKINGNMDDGTFVFKRPKGVEMIESPSLDLGEQ